MVRAGDVIRASDLNTQACRVNRSAGTTIAQGSDVVVNFNTEIFDTDAMHDTSINNSRITANTAGVYWIGFVGTLEAHSSYTRVVAVILLNGTTPIARNGGFGASAGVAPTLNVDTMYYLNVGDYVEITVRHDGTGGGRALEALADRSPHFYAARIGA